MAEPKEFIIPVSWEVYSNIIVTGVETLEEARAAVEADLDMIPLGVNNEYVDGSYRIDAETEEDLEQAQDNIVKGVLMEVGKGPGGKNRYTTL